MIANAEYIERHFSQRQVISILFFILRDKCLYIDPNERKDLKNLLKAAQRQLTFIQQGEPGCFLGCQPSSTKFLKELYDKVVYSRKMACRWFGHHNITLEQQKLLHTNRQAIGRTIRD